jgi:hypothetical protein
MNGFVGSGSRPLRASGPALVLLAEPVAAHGPVAHREASGERGERHLAQPHARPPGSTLATFRSARDPSHRSRLLKEPHRVAGNSAGIQRHAKRQRRGVLKRYNHGLGAALRWSSLLLALLAPAVAQAQFALDGLNFPSAMPGGALGLGHLQNRVRLGTGAASLGFLTGVGGVAFGGVAVPVPGLELLDLAYDPARPDGERLRVTVLRDGSSAEEVAAPIADWLLGPVLRFALDDQDAAATLFGSASTDEETRRQRELGNDIINYHPAFIDTLAGVRLLHADILILYQGAAELPTIDGQPLLGATEESGDIAENANALASLHEYLATLPDDPFRSYVVGDFGQTVSVSAQDGELRLEGNPYWHCWKLRTEDPAEQELATNMADLWGRRIVEREFQHDSLYLSDVEVSGIYSQEYIQARFDAIFDARISRALLATMPDYSDALSARIAALGGINPTVYAALRTSMQHVALFRRMRQTVPDAVSAIAGELEGLSPQPVVQTPLLFQPPSL